jgi:hypothetical protein
MDEMDKPLLVVREAAANEKVTDFVMDVSVSDESASNAAGWSHEFNPKYNVSQYLESESMGNLDGASYMIHLEVHGARERELEQLLDNIATATKDTIGNLAFFLQAGKLEWVGADSATSLIGKAFADKRQNACTRDEEEARLLLEIVENDNPRRKDIPVIL